MDIKGETYAFELALDIQARTNGLMHREPLLDGKGMFFIFPNSDERSFWMKHCLFDIDIVFLDSRGTVLSTHTMKVEPPKEFDESDFEYEQRLKHYWSYGPAQFAMEFNAETNKKLNIKVNDRISLDLNYLKSLAR